MLRKSIAFMILPVLATIINAGGDMGGGGLPEKFKRTFVLEDRGRLQGDRRLPYKIVLLGDEHRKGDGRLVVNMLVHIGNNVNRFRAFYDGGNRIHDEYTDGNDLIKFEFNMNRSMSDDTLYLNGVFTIFRGRTRVREKVVYLNYVGTLPAGAQKSLINGSPEDFQHFVKNARCLFRAEKGTIRSGQFPVFTIEISYDGTNPYELLWDKDFGHVLWGGKFVVVAASSGQEKSTKEMGSITSGTYPPRERMIVKQGGRITARLDFSTYPARSVSRIFPASGRVEVQLLLMYSSPKGELYMPLGDKVRITIR